MQQIKLLLIFTVLSGAILFASSNSVVTTEAVVCEDLYKGSAKVICEQAAGGSGSGSCQWMWIDYNHDGVMQSATEWKCL